MAKQKYHFETLQLHVGQEQADPATDARAVPIYQTTSYVFHDCQHAADRFALKDAGNVYGRLTNSTQAVLEERVAALEGGVAGLAVASGAAAVTYAITNIANAGDHVVASKTIYGGTYNLLAHTLSKFGITTTFVDPDDYEELEAAIKDNTEHGADIVVHSATKFIGGHGTSLGGVIVDGGTFDWKKNPEKFPGFNKPDASYHGLVFGDIPAPFVTRVRTLLLRDQGAAISPFNAFILLQGLETLSLRVERHVFNTLKVLEYLENQPLVKKINHPAEASHPNHDLYERYFPNGAGSIFTFEIDGDQQKAFDFIDHLKIFSLLANVADVKSLVIHPLSTTHSELSVEEAADQGIYPSTIRLSIGTEHYKDIIADLDQAFEAVK